MKPGKQAPIGVLLAGAVGFGVLIGVAFDQPIFRLLRFACEIAVYHWVAVLLVMLLLVVLLSLGYGLSAMKRAEVQGRELARLSKEEYEKIRSEALDSVADEMRKADVISRQAKEQRWLLKRLAVSVLKQAEDLQRNADNLVYCVESVGKVLKRKGRHLLDECPEPVKAGQILEKSNRTIEELNGVLRGMRDQFPEIINAVPELKPIKRVPVKSDCENPRGVLESVYLAQRHADFIRGYDDDKEYKKKEDVIKTKPRRRRRKR